MFTYVQRWVCVYCLSQAGLHGHEVCSHMFRDEWVSIACHRQACMVMKYVHICSEMSECLLPVTGRLAWSWSMFTYVQRWVSVYCLSQAGLHGHEVCSHMLLMRGYYRRMLVLSITRVYRESVLYHSLVKVHTSSVLTSVPACSFIPCQSVSEGWNWKGTLSEGWNWKGTLSEGWN